MFRHLRTTLTLALLALLPLAAFAHAKPKVANPAPNSTVTAPANVTITFTEALEPKFSFIDVSDSKGAQVNKAVSQPVAGDPATLTLALPTLAPGVYTVKWITVATDGHRLTGNYNFTVQ
jgi:methionine-rich copper-binding protein CopC